MFHFEIYLFSTTMQCYLDLAIERTRKLCKFTNLVKYSSMSEVQY